jgi:hypothetical protein
MNETCLYYDCSLQVSHWILTFLIERSLHTHSEQWQHYQSVVLSVAVGQIEHLPLAQNGPVGFEKTHTICKKQYIDDYFVSVGLK